MLLLCCPLLLIIVGTQASIKMLPRHARPRSRRSSRVSASLGWPCGLSSRTTRRQARKDHLLFSGGWFNECASQVAVAQKHSCSALSFQLLSRFFASFGGLSQLHHRPGLTIGGSGQLCTRLWFLRHVSFGFIRRPQAEIWWTFGCEVF